MVEYLHNTPSNGIATVQELDAAYRDDHRRAVLPVFSNWPPIIPYLIFCMLLVPYCKISLTRIRIKPLHLFLILIQIIGGLGIYTALSFYDPLVAQGIFICVLAPTATSAAVITGMLGGERRLAGHLRSAEQSLRRCTIPLIFSFIGEHVSMPFGHSFGIIAVR